MNAATDKPIVIFASGQGSNAAAIIAYFKKAGGARVALIVSNKADAGVLELAAREAIPFLIIDRETFKGALLTEQLQELEPALIVLAGFLWKIPPGLIGRFAGKIVNIHPALLPAYGGKGMWGHHVHGAVLAAGEAQSGITIHAVNEQYDEGAILLQARCAVLPGDDADALAARVLKLEHYYYPRAIEAMLQGLQAQ